MEPNLLRDALIVLVLAALLLAARVPWRTVFLLVGLVAIATVALDALITEFVGSD